MRVAVVPGPGQSGLLCPLSEDGTRAGPVVHEEDLCDAIARHEEIVRWVWPATAALYPRLLQAGVRVGRCHDVALAQALIEARQAGAKAARVGAADPGGAGLAAAGTGADAANSWADAAGTGAGVPADALATLRAATRWHQPGPGSEAAALAAQQALFDPAEAADESGSLPAPRETLDALIEVHAYQVAQIAADEHPARFGLLAAAESAGGIVAAEMSLAGLPWRPAAHDELLTDMLGARPPAGSRPARLTELAAQVSAALGASRPVNIDSPGQLIKALASAGIRVESTRLAVLRDIDHPVIAPLLEYKELSRLHSAFGWSWLDTWVSGGRFRPEYLVGGVVSGRWASRGGGALQIPRTLRRAVVADPGWVLVVADAAQLEPRVLAALAGDRAFATAAAAGDLYTELAAAFGGDRRKAKVAMLSAMYGGAGGEAGQLLAVLRHRFPTASGYVEAAARAGEEGRVVRSVLGRTCPPPSARWRALTEEAADPDAERDPDAGRASRARGRFTRNFVVQASAADWALVMLVSLRAALSKIVMHNRPRTAMPHTDAGAPQLVFFQHDEVIVHCPAELADEVAQAAEQAAKEASRLVFGQTQVAFPLNLAIVECYADAK